MIRTFKTFQSGVGDSIFLLLKQGESLFSIMVDCGVFTDEIKNYLQNNLSNHIDLLIVTHIDSDHILRIESMLTTISPTIGRILFNCYQRDPNTGKVRLDSVKKRRTFSVQSLVTHWIIC